MLAASEHETTLAILANQIPHAQTCSGTTALHVAASRGLDRIVARLIAHGAKVDTRDAQDRTPLHCAVANGYKQTSRLLLSNKALIYKTPLVDINAQNKQGQTALYIAIADQRYDLARTLLNEGADVNCQAPSSGSLLHFASKYASEDMVEELLIEGANANAVCTMEGETGSPLYTAVVHNRIGVAALLLQFGADVNQPYTTRKGRFPLILYAYQHHKMALFELFRKAGADVNASNPLGMTILHYAASLGIHFQDHTLVSALIRDDGARIDSQAADLNTPLHMSCYYGNWEMAALLVSLGADTSLRNAKGRTPHDIAVKGKHARIKYMLELTAQASPGHEQQEQQQQCHQEHQWDQEQQQQSSADLEPENVLVRSEL
ncbi:hypothetical protein MBLNU459_g5133t1 [Dothideomycetes sp. NU459]